MRIESHDNAFRPPLFGFPYRRAYYPAMADMDAVEYPYSQDRLFHILTSRSSKPGLEIDLSPAISIESFNMNSPEAVRRRKER